jgi:hypothetical protein
VKPPKRKPGGAVHDGIASVACCMATGPPTALVAGLVTAQSPAVDILAARRAITLAYSTGSSAQLKEEARAP